MWSVSVMGVIEEVVVRKRSSLAIMSFPGFFVREISVDLFSRKRFDIELVLFEIIFVEEIMGVMK